MAIKKIEEIPAKRSLTKEYNKRKITQREHVRRDIQNAFKSRISPFEFAGNYYNYDSLKLVADSEIGRMLGQHVDSILERVDPEGDFRWTKYGDILRFVEPNCYKVVARKLEDRTHVYCELNFDYIDNLERVICLKMHEAKCRR